nr:nucleoside deaminase [Corynebacterium choanae]
MIGGFLPQPVWLHEAEALMQQAVEVAHQTPAGDIPVGCIIVDPSGNLVACGTNQREATGDPTAHAEIVAIRQAVQHLQDSWRLADCTLVVTLEPCAMCAGAIQASRIGTVYFGAYEPKTGACGSVVDLLRGRGRITDVAVRGGIAEAACAELLLAFFRALRDQEAGGE